MANDSSSGRDVGHPGSGYCASLAVAKRVCRAGDRSIRRECLDHVVVMGERHPPENPVEVPRLLQRDPDPLIAWKDAPEPRTVQPPAQGRVVEVLASEGFITNICGERREPIGRISGRHRSCKNDRGM